MTGSRIPRMDLTTPAPVTVINEEQLKQSGKISLGDFLQTLPEQGNAINTAVNNGGDGSVRVSLRSLGSFRTLVLINGRRMVAGGTGADAAVDLNSIPTAAIERIEILKDGASAIYGSDALGGVINIIMRKDWTGAEATAYAGISGQGDTQTYDVNATSATGNKNGTILFSAGYSLQEKAMAGDRKFSETQLFYDAVGLNNGAGILGEYQSGSSRTPGGRVSKAGVGNGMWTALKAANPGPGYLIHDATMDPVVGCLAAADYTGNPSDCQWRSMNTTNMAPEGDLYNYAPFNYLVTPSQRVSVWSSGDHKFGNVVRGFYETSYVNRKSDQQLAPEPLIIGAGGVTDPGGNLVPISSQNMYNPFGKNFTNASRRLDEFGFRQYAQDVHTFRVLGGADGNLPDLLGPLGHWTWETTASYGRTFSTDTNSGNLQASRVAAALGPSVDGNCVNEAGDPISGCVPLDLFHGSGTITQDQVDYLTYTGTSSGLNDLIELQVNTSGKLFEITPSRPVGLAIGYEYRFVRGEYINEPLTAKFDSSNGGAYDTAGSYYANEGYAELSVPLVANVIGAEEVEASAAVRGYSYNSFGAGATYKLGLRWTPIRDVTLRGTYSTGFRAPSIPELFAGQYDNFPIVSDPCASTTDPDILRRCDTAANNGDDSVQLRTRNGGNPDLDPETAKIFTFGAVFEPRWVKDLSFTVDYYNTAIDKAIATIGESTILSGCYVTGKQPQYCDLVERDEASQQITYIHNLNQNVGEEEAEGIDFAARYGLTAGGFGRFRLSVDLTYLYKHNQTLADGTVVHGKDTFDLLASSGSGGTNPTWKGLAGVTWAMGGIGAGVITRYISGFHECGNSYGDFSGDGLCYVDDTFKRKVDAYNTYDAFVSYDLSTGYGDTRVAVGVNNVFDTPPVKIYNSFASATDQYTYDQIGRFFYLRLAQQI